MRAHIIVANLFMPQALHHGIDYRCALVALARAVEHQECLARKQVGLAIHFHFGQEIELFAPGARYLAQIVNQHRAANFRIFDDPVVEHTATR